MYTCTLLVGLQSEEFCAVPVYCGYLHLYMHAQLMDYKVGGSSLPLDIFLLSTFCI